MQYKITGVGVKNIEGSVSIIFADGSKKTATPAMLSRIGPAVGDFWIIASQGDGVYEYLNPKAVFEAKYNLLNE